MKSPLLKTLLVFTGLFLSGYGNIQAQQSLVYSHYFLNPFLYNPSFVAPNGYTELYLNYRNQWAGIQGAPVTETVSLHVPLSYKMGMAFTGYQDKAGVLKTTTGLVTFAYQVYLGNSIRDDHKIGFGLSAGVKSTSINGGDAYANDPVNGTTSSFDGQFGIHYQRKNFKLGFAIPQLFKTYVASQQDFNKVGVKQVKTTITSASYTIQLSSRLAFEPIVTYRTYENTPSQFEGLGVFHIDNIAWFGGSYRQDYGATAFVGVNVKDKLKLGYAYEFAPSQVNALGNGTHEMQLILRLGKKKERPHGKIKTKIKEVAARAVENDNDEAPQAKEDKAKVEKTKEEAPSAPASELPSKAKEVTTQQATVQTQPVTSAIVHKDTEPAKKDAVKSLSGNALPPGHYVVVGAFRSSVNAKNYARTLRRAAYPAEIAFYPEKSYYIVHLANASTLPEAQELRNKYRQMSRYTFRDTWILIIE
ncbi:MAG TPA: PorP/SprF family type IX secretion system membrane protein [Ohtaekwangia sp.]|uniref:PorP/SprF family type IX secretion system membrane protein n=1 Tax=Ohtaekwangia sp. TaxID=2066019 RepID=UPI002F94034E